MNENIVDNNMEVEINLQRLISAVWKKLWVIVLTAVISAAAVFTGTYYLITPQYESSAMFYVNNNSLSVGDTSFSISQGDITASKDLVESYIVILKTRTSLLDVIDYAGVDRTYTELRDMISAASVNSTEIFEVVVTSPDPEEAEEIANAIAYILPKRISSIIEGTSAKVVDTAIIAASPSSPSYTKNTILGFLIGVVISAGIIVLKEIFNITIRTEEDIQQSCDHPILAAVPDMAAPSKGGYYYYNNNSKKKKSDRRWSASQQTSLIGSEISFTASEAYKLLRTKLQFSFADANTCHVIGISSALSGEGKSLSSINVAYALSQLDNKKVLLIDCDMRRPSLATKLPIRKFPGLSNYLSGQSPLDTLIQKCGISHEEDAFEIISAGQIPPNPTELLSSERMNEMLKHLKESYDYIILDFPPVGEVSDALTVAKQTDGILLVVRQNYCNRVVLASAVQQFEFIKSRILGVVYNCTGEFGGGYGYGKKYYKKYYKKYESSYASASRAANARKRAAEKSAQKSSEGTPEEGKAEA